MLKRFLMNVFVAVYLIGRAVQSLLGFNRAVLLITLTHDQTEIDATLLAVEASAGELRDMALGADMCVNNFIARKQENKS